jgi:hypothetical protein
MEVEGFDGGESAAQTVTGKTSDMAREHDVQPAPSLAHSEGDSSLEPKNASKVQSHFEEAESGTLHTATPAERVDKCDTENIQMGTTTEHATPPSSPEKNKKIKTEKETPKFRERTRSKTRYFAAS